MAQVSERRSEAADTAGWHERMLTTSSSVFYVGPAWGRILRVHGASNMYETQRERKEYVAR